MTTIIDTLIIKMDLDPALFMTAQKQAGAAFIKTREEGVKSHKEIEAAAHKVTEALSAAARQALSLFAVFIGGRGIKEWLEGLTRAQMTLYNLSFGLKSTAQDISAWGMLVERIGGRAIDAQSAFRSFSDQIQELKSGGTGASFLEPMSKLFGFSGTKAKFNINKAIHETFLDIAEASEASAKKDPEQTLHWLQQMGFAIEMARLLMRGREYLNAEVERAKRLAPTKEEILQTAKLRSKFSELQQVLGSIGDTIVAGLAKPLTELINKFREWLLLNRVDIKEKIEEAFKTLEDGVKHIKEDWLAAWAILKPRWEAIDKFVNENIKGGWIRIIGILMGIQLLAWVTNIIGLLNPVTRTIWLTIAFAQGVYRFSSKERFMEDMRTLEEAIWGTPTERDPDVPHGREMHGGSVEDEMQSMIASWGDSSQLMRNTEEPVFRAALRALKAFDPFSTGSSGGGVNRFRGGLRRGHGGHEGAEGLRSHPSMPGTTAKLTGASNAEREAYNRQVAISLGKDPDQAIAVMRSEGGTNYYNPEGSYGDFQLFMHGGVGNIARAHGIDPTDPKQWKAADRFAQEYAAGMHGNKRPGWGEWSGARRQGIYDWHPYRGKPESSLDPIGAKHIASMQNRIIQHQVSNDIRIAQLHVDASGASDAEGIAAQIHPALQSTIPQDQDYAGSTRTV